MQHLSLLKKLTGKRSILNFLLWLGFSANQCAAQHPAAQVSYHFKSDTLVIESGKTFSNVLIINNQSKEQVSLVRNGKNQNADLAILRLPDTINLAAGQIKSFPVKYYADQQTITSNFQAFELKLRLTGQHVSVNSSASFFTQLLQPGGLLLSVPSNEIYLDPLTGKAELQLQLFNSGMIPLTFDLNLSGMPKGLEFIGPKATITLPAGTEKIIPFMAVNKSATNAPADFLVIVKAMDQSTNEIASVKLRIMTLSSNRNLVLREQDINYQNRPNTLSLNYITANNFNSLQLLSTGAVPLKKEQQLNYNLNLNYSPLSAGRLYTSDSFLEYKNQLWAVKAGNIYTNLNFNVNGRGIKASAVPGRNKSINAYLLENNNTLFSNIPNSSSGGITLALEYLNSHQAGTDKSRIILLRSADHLSARTINLFSAKQLLISAKDTEFSIGAGYSTLQLNHMRSKYFQGLSAELNYNQKFDHFKISSTDYYSTPNYSGTRTGTLYSDNTITFSPEQHSVFSAKLSLMSNRPQYLSRLANDFVKKTSQYGTQTYELGYEKSFRKYRIGIHPYYFVQQMLPNNLTETTTQQWKSSSLRARINLNYNDAFQSVDLTADNGYTTQNTSKMPPAPFFSSRINLYYRNNIFGISSFFQHNTFYISDALANVGGKSQNMFSIGPNINFSALKNRMSFTTSANYSYYGYNGSQNYTINAHSRLLLKDQWVLSMNLFYGMSRQQRTTIYNPEKGLDYNQTDLSYRDISYFSNRQLSFGIEKHFGAPAGQKTWKLRLTYFEDSNANGLRDPRERVIPGIFVKMNQLAAITNVSGKVQFSAPSGEYNISTVNQNGWSSVGPGTILLSSDKQIEMGMVKTIKLTGALQVLSQDFIHKQTILSGIRVNAMGPAGTIYTSVCNATGEFSFYLPQGKYLVYIKNPGESLSMINEREEILLRPGELNNLLFKAKNNGITVDVKTF